MRWQYTPYEVSLLMAAAASVSLAVFAWRRRPTPGSVSFAVLMLAVAEWTFGYALELASADVRSILFWGNVECFGVVTVPAAWLTFAINYTGRERWLTRRNRILLAVEPLFILACAWTDSGHGLLRGTTRLSTVAGFTVLISTHGFAFWLNLAYSYALLLLGTMLIGPLFQGLLRPNVLYRGQASMLVIAVVVPWASNIIFVAGFSPFPGLDLTPFAFTLSGAALAWSLMRFRLLDIVPIARDAVIESMDTAVIVLDDHARVLDLNSAAQRIFGQQFRAAIGSPSSRLFEAWPNLIHYCDDAPSARIEATVLAPASPCWYDVRVSPLRDRSGHITGRIVILDDITAHIQAEQAVRDSEERFRTLFQEAPIGMVLVDQDERLVKVNQAFCDMLGYTERDLLARTLAEITHPEDVDALAALTAHTADGQPARYQVEQRYLKKSREILWAEVTATVIQNGDGSLYRLAMIQDVFERKRAALLEDEQRHVAYELHDGLAQVAAGAHLHLQAFAGHYRPRSIQARQELSRALELAQRAAREARHVIAGLRPTVVEELGLATALRMHVEAMRADGWNITYEEAFGPDRLPPAIETAIFRVALEALTNVRKHAGTAPARLTIEHDGAVVCLEVQDWGIGFKPSAPVARGAGGHIGLHEMRDRIALLGGQFEIASRPGAGTRIRAEVPVPAPEAADLTPAGGPERMGSERGAP